jgi:hypothetical protein
MTVRNPHYLLQFFNFTHLPGALQDVSKPFCELAHRLDDELPLNPELTASLRFLLQAKDCAVRAVLFKEQS